MPYTPTDLEREKASQYCALIERAEELLNEQADLKPHEAAGLFIFAALLAKQRSIVVEGDDPSFRPDTLAFFLRLGAWLQSSSMFLAITIGVVRELTPKARKHLRETGNFPR